MNRTVSAIGALVIFAGSVLGQASFTTTGYIQNFDAMGTAGTTRPTGFSHWTGPASSSANDVFNAATTNAQIGTALSAFTQRSVALAVFSQAGVNPPSNQSITASTSGFNAAFSANTSNRALGSTAVTGVSGVAMQLALVNNSGATLTNIDISYDFIAFSRGTPQGGTAGTYGIGTESELPGFRVFISTTGDAGPWTNISGLNFAPPVNAAVGFTQSVSAQNVPVGSWTPGSTLTIRWFKDNENLSSPDPLYGIDAITILPTPGAAALMALGALAIGRRRH